MSIRHWMNQPLEEHLKLRDDAWSAHFRFLSLSLHGSTSEPRYTAIMEKQAAPVEERNAPLVPAEEFQKVFDNNADDGFGPVIIAATGPASDARFTAVFRKSKPIPLTRFGLKSGDDKNPLTIQGMNKQAMLEGLILRWAASYGDEDDPCFAAIWAPNHEKVIWNADGISESAGKFQERFDAQQTRWARPAFVTLNSDSRYFSLFVNNQVGRWETRIGMTRAEYKREFDERTSKEQGFQPICVQAAGEDEDTRYAAIFVKGKGDAVPYEFHARGPVANKKIDSLFEYVMQNTPSRHMSVAIVHKSKLVFARGYTLAEPGHPVCEPTTCFRIASVSKTITALAIYQLIEKHELELWHSMQDILKLRTPSGDAPEASKFKNIMIKQLLEHTSGLNPDAFRSEIDVWNAWNDDGPNGPYHLPMSADQTDAYVASLDLAHTPEVVQEYNNCAYYLLGRILAKVRKRDTPIDALRDFLFEPLGITRIRRARSLLKDQVDDEARYQINEAGSDDNHDKRLTISVAASVMSGDRPIVPTDYGTEHYEKGEGFGGLSAAATDLARILAVMMVPHDTPVLKRRTLEAMLDNGVACQAKWKGLAGHGLDVVSRISDGIYYGQKGGRLPASGTTFQFNGDWGFVCNLSGGMGKTHDEAGIYPDFPDLMNIARSVDWGDGDLFPHFGMAPLGAKAAGA